MVKPPGEYLRNYNLPISGATATTLAPLTTFLPMRYCAKQLGRNNYQFYNADLNAEGRVRRQLEAGLRLGLEREEFRLQYQPKVDPHSGRIASAEALLRWRHPTHGMVPPGRLQIDVNVSVRQFFAPDFVESVAAIFRETGLPANGLEIELTESMVMNDVNSAIDVVTALRALGVQLSIDDSGTGYSSLAYLKRFPISVLKVDQSFVRDIDKDEDSKTIVISFIELAHRLGLKVVAEGVETTSQFGYLRSLDCDEIQGYYFSRPPDVRLFAILCAQQAQMLTVLEGS